MSDYIKREDAIKAMKTASMLHEKLGLMFDVEQLLNSIPSADVERKRGEWIVHETEPYKDWCKCSECGCYWELSIVEYCCMNYCPNCGADMRGGSDE